MTDSAASDIDPRSYLLARWNEEEAVAKAASPGPWMVKDLGDAEFTSSDNCGWWWVWQESKLPHYGGVIQIDHTPGAVGVASITDAEQGARERADATHIARWNPAAVLADIAAKREILAWIGAHEFDRNGSAWGILCALAKPYSGRDDFDPSWGSE